MGNSNCCVRKEKDDSEADGLRGFVPGPSKRKRVCILPGVLLRKLAAMGIEPSLRPLDILSAEKHIFDAKEVKTGIGRVVLYSRTVKAKACEWVWKGAREGDVLQSAAGHPNIIRMLAYFEAETTEEGSHGPCMVLERVEPLGFDLCHVFNQYAHANRVMPMMQMLDYTGQLLGAAECLHEHGWIHCDIKVENVLITANHTAKLIDMGLAKRAGVEEPPDRVGYMPPEFGQADVLAHASADIWCLGSLMVSLSCRQHLDLIPGTPEYAAALESGVIGFIQNTWKISLDPTVLEALEGTMQWKPQDRWTDSDFRQWLAPRARVSPASASEYLAITEHALETASENFGRLNGQRITGYGINATRGSRWVDKYVGMHPGIERHQVLDLIGDGVTVLFIDQGQRGLIKFPGPRDKIRPGDWIYLRTRTGGGNDEEACRVAALVEEAHKTKDRCVVEIFLEFDEFVFPEHCYGAAIGPTAEEGGVAMDLRKNFGIGLTFIKRLAMASRTPRGPPKGRTLSRKKTAELGEQETELVEIRRDTVVEPGDMGIVVRVPDRATGLTKSIISDDMLDKLLDESSFRQVLSLPSHGTMSSSRLSG